MSDWQFLIVMILLTMLNVGLLGLMLKLYTEIFKERAMSRRSEVTSRSLG